MSKLEINLGINSYPIYIEENILGSVLEYIAPVFRGKKIMIVSDSNVFPIYGEMITKQMEEKYECCSHVFTAGEQSKHLGVVQEVYTSLIENNFSRTDLIIALGGGVVGDLAGFVAATYLRGISYIQIPTTLLAQVDSSVGGKVAVDLPQGKNMVGNFYHPKMVFIDPKVLESLTERYFRDGMGEVIKYGCIQSESLFKKLKNIKDKEELMQKIGDIIYECIDCKRIVVEEDERDTGSRMILNFGHTLGHAVEQYYGYARESHGEAVAIGMYEIMKIAEEAGVTEPGMAQEIKDLLVQYGLPFACDVDRNLLLQAIQKDKKNLSGSLNIILLSRIGEACIYKTEAEFFKA
ncbi:MAG: 3-dehydroquinate synthase [Eubacteriales bacterium]